jgi:hypothetical protein
MAKSSRIWYNVSAKNNKNTKIQEDRHMSIITQKTYDEQSSIKSVTWFFNYYNLGQALKKAGAYKQRGILVSIIIRYLLSLIYLGKSMYEDMRSSRPFAQGFSKDTVYRLLNSLSVNWQAFLLSIASKVIADLDRLTSNARLTAFVIDDTVFKILFGKKTELVSRVHDHAAKGKNKFTWGFRLLTLGWTDGTSFIPLSFRHIASADKKNQRCGCKPGLDKRGRAYRIRKEAVSKATDVLIMHLKAALSAGVTARHVLFDSWFAYPATIIKIHALKLHVTARVKDAANIQYLKDGEKKTARQIFKENRKRPGKSRYLLSVQVSINSEGHAIPARLVYVRNRSKRNKWIALLTTDLSLDEKEIIALYGRRWQIEVFFKICKSYLKLAKEFQQLSYDAITAHTTIVMTRYMILSVEKRKQEDPRSLGELFYESFDEVDDIRFEQALILIISLLADTLNDAALGLSEEQIEQIMDDFIQRLPLNIRSCLCPAFAA